MYIKIGSKNFCLSLIVRLFSDFYLNLKKEKFILFNNCLKPVIKHVILKTVTAYL